MDHDFILSQRDGRPMYQQIMEQIRLKISVGDWPEGHPLPSIRELAVAVRVSVITIKRAYQELEHEGVIHTQQGKGSFVAEQVADKLPHNRDEIEQYLHRAVDLAVAAGMNQDEVIEQLKRVWRRDPSNKTGRKT